MGELIYNKMTGLGMSMHHILAALREANLPEAPDAWTQDDLMKLSSLLRKYSKPMIVALDKADVATDETLQRMAHIEHYLSIPTCAQSELALRRAAKAQLIGYLPGDEQIRIADPTKLNQAQKK